MKTSIFLLIAICLTGCAWWQPDGEKASKAQALSAPVPNSVTLGWDDNQVGPPRTYSVHRGVTPSVYTNVVKGITAKTYTATGLTPGVKYYFASTTTASGLESKFSNEISYTYTNPPAPPVTKAFDQFVIERRWAAGKPWVSVTTNTFPATNALSTYRGTTRRILQ